MFAVRNMYPCDVSYDGGLIIIIGSKKNHIAIPNAFYLCAICVKIEIESSKSDQFKTNSDSGNNHAPTLTNEIGTSAITNEQKG